MNTYKTFEDGHIEYFSVNGIGSGFRAFDSQSAALSYINSTNDIFDGVEFHKELNGVSLLKSE